MKDLRIKYGLSQTEIDKILKLNNGTCSRWERNNNAPRYVVALLKVILESEVK